MDIIGGHSLPAIADDAQVRLGKFEYAFWIGHVLAIGFIKLTLLTFFRVLFRGTHANPNVRTVPANAETFYYTGRAFWTPFDYANWTLITLVVLWTAVFLFSEIFACGLDPAASWSSLASLRGQKCVDTFGLQAANAASNWVLDLAIFIEPLLMIRVLNMASKRKIQLSLVFLGSGFAVIAGLLRMIPWLQIKIQDLTHPVIRILATNLSIADQTAIVSIVLFWTYIEIGTGFLVACVPRSAWVFDKVSFSSLYYKLRSFSSIKLSSKGGRSSSHTKEAESQELKQSSSLRSQEFTSNYHSAAVSA
ncbi:hypothetical protein B0T17DRAFT_603369 [Bombardia bombarda]|uniref:Rhodopsin domain-containing protein n=1 Tax=Bombardia bombarda TaxID=252184 RepID=A0AA39T0T1_9PEZI|nr:hypothetical protein B0T17DRAFT_603369 [Bombardia bombarda]